MICRALICGNVEEAVDRCLEGNKISDALVIASLGKQSFMKDYYFFVALVVVYTFTMGFNNF